MPQSPRNIWEYIFYKFESFEFERQQKKYLNLLDGTGLLKSSLVNSSFSSIISSASKFQIFFEDFPAKFKEMEAPTLISGWKKTYLKLIRYPRIKLIIRI